MVSSFYSLAIIPALVCPTLQFLLEFLEEELQGREDECREDGE